MRRNRLKEIEELYRRLIMITEGKGLYKIDNKVRSDIYKKIVEDVEFLSEKQNRHPSWSKDYWDIDREIRMLLLKEIQIIIDDYILAKKNGNLKQWESMYGDFDHYKDIFYALRMDAGYDKKKKQIQRMKFVKGKWERVEFTKIG